MLSAPITCHDFIRDLGSAAKTTQDKLEAWAVAVNTAELFGLGLGANNDWELRGDGLRAEAERCSELTRGGISFDFTSMISFIKLVLKCQTYVYQSTIMCQP